MALSQFSFTKQGDPGMAKFARDRRLAEVLAQQALTPDPSQMAGGYVVRQSALNPLAKMAQALASRKIDERADTGERDYVRQRSEDVARAIAEARRAGDGREAQPAIEAPPDELGGGPGRPELEARAPNPMRTYEALAGVDDPIVKQFGLQSMLANIGPKAPIKLSKDDRLVDPTNYGTIVGPQERAKMTRVEIPDGRGGVRVGFVDMNNPNPMQTFQEAGTQGAKAEVLPSGQAINPYDVQPGTVFNDPNKIMQIGPNGPVVNQPLVDAKKSVAKAGASTQAVTVNTDKTLFGHLAGKVGEQIAAGADQARAAVGTLQTVGQINEALNTGKVVAGPLTTARVFLDQVGQVLGMAGKDSTERLTNTRKAIQGLAQLELDAAQQMKGQGQITEAERSIIRRAASGDIDGMTGPELRVLMRSLEKTARYKIQANQANVDRLKADPQSGAVPRYMEVPMPAEYQGPDRRTAPRQGSGRVVVDY